MQWLQERTEFEKLVSQRRTDFSQIWNKKLFKNVLDNLGDDSKLT